MHARFGREKAIESSLISVVVFLVFIFETAGATATEATGRAATGVARDGGIIVAVSFPAAIDAASGKVAVGAFDEVASVGAWAD